MPSVSKKQQRFMGMVRAEQQGKLKNASPEVMKTAHSMTAKSAKEFASTKRKGLPEKVGQRTHGKRIFLKRTAAGHFISKKKMKHLKPKGEKGKAMVHKLGRNFKTGGFNEIAGKAAKEYGSAEAGKKVAGAIYQKMVAKRTGGKRTTLKRNA